MNAVEIIRKKRNNFELTAEEINFIIREYCNNKIADYQISALLMAIYFNGMTEDETFNLTSAYINSGQKIDLSFIKNPKVDKHSTGGVGDKISLLLAPIVAACGVTVPMISGRGLGHTGGTLDKLESIPNFKTNLSIEEFKKIISEINVSMIGQTSEIVPADKKIYALRDVTSTVDSIPLISASIMSKKVASGIDSLVLDIKYGSGAIFQDYHKSIELAKALINIGNKFNKNVIAIITSMDEPLGKMVGNWLEVVETVLCLRGKIVPDLLDVTFRLSAEMLSLAGKINSIEEGINLCKQKIEDGSAYRKFLEIVKLQNGDLQILDDLSNYPKSKYTFSVTAKTSGFINSINTREVGLIANSAGAGRLTMNDKIDPKAGIVFSKKIGDEVKSGEFLATIYTDINDQHFEENLRNCFTIGSEKIKLKPLIRAKVTKNGVEEY
ncbi:MAG: thymidine phosphorylase [Bacteroidetes bacterium]|nr:thymidine phosphorylase [Bacteroidota bacterium]